MKTCRSCWRRRWAWFGVGLLLCTPLGCRRTPTLERDGGVRLVYEIDRERMAEVFDDPDWSPSLEELPGLRATLANRLGGYPGVTIAPVDESSLEILVPGVKQEEGEHLRMLISRWGNLEFLIVANHEDHAELIGLALSSGVDGNYVRNGGRRVARWVDVATEDASLREFPDYQGVDARDVLRARRDGDDYEPVEIPREIAAQIARDELNLAQALAQLGYRDLQALVVVEPPGLNISGVHLRRATAWHDDTLSPAVLFSMTDDGAKLLERLTANHLPDPTRDLYRRLAIIMDDVMISAPRLMSVIGREGQITGNFTQQQVDTMVALLRAGRLPMLLKAEPAREEWIAPP